MTESLRSLAFELDCDMGWIDSRIEILNDTKVLLNYLREDMDGAVYKKEEAAYYRENHRMVRVISELMHYTVEDLAKTFKKADKKTDEILRIATIKEKSPVAGNDKALV